MRAQLVLSLAAGLALIAGGAAAQQATETALFAGGCFWSVEANFDKVEGVLATTSGFAGGTVENPSYSEVVRGGTGHYETVEIVYDPAVVDFDRLLTVFWHTTDPTDAGGQFCDRGGIYRTAIFALDAEQERLALASMEALEAETGYSIVTEILPAAPFYAAEAYHQNFHLTNPDHYQRYRIGCGRDGRLAALWGDKAYLGTSENPFSD